MMNLYNECKDPKEQPIPKEWIDLDEATVSDALDTILETFLDEVFSSSSKLSREDFIEKLRNEHKHWLQPHFLRARLY